MTIRFSNPEYYPNERKPFRKEFTLSTALVLTQFIAS
jgi:hypothetical protein